MNFNSAQFANVFAAVMNAAANSPRRTRAITRAAEALQSGELVVTLLYNGALVTSPNDSYFVNLHRACPAATLRGHWECRHRAAVRLCERLEAKTARPAVSRADIIADIKAAWSRRFPTESLADELMRRFRRNQLEMLSIDFLAAIRAAIASRRWLACRRVPALQRQPRPTACARGV
jgi:hypothetical protein